MQVTDVAASTLLYPSGGTTCGDTTVPQIYKDSGFSQTDTDLLSFVSIIYDGAVSFVAQAGPCALSRWPTYGHVRYNAYYVDTDITKTGDFQNNVYTTVI